MTVPECGLLTLIQPALYLPSPSPGSVAWKYDLLSSKTRTPGCDGKFTVPNAVLWITNGSVLSRPNVESYDCSRTRATEPSGLWMTPGWASTGRIKPWPGWSPTLLSANE